MKFTKLLTAAALSAASLSAFADITVQGTSFAAGAATQSTLMGTFAAYSAGATPGAFAFAPAMGGYQGVGVAGGVNGEIDSKERIVGTLNQAYGISQFTLGLFFDGGEYGDVQERAEVKVTYADNSFGTFVLTAISSTVATWTNAAGVVTNLALADLGKGGVWSVTNPFGNQKVTSIAFAALPGICKAGATCTSQSDFTLVSVTAVPEAETYAMMLAGLGLMGAIARRRNKAKAA